MVSQKSLTQHEIFFIYNNLEKILKLSNKVISKLIKLNNICALNTSAMVSQKSLKEKNERQREKRNKVESKEMYKIATTCGTKIIFLWCL